MNKKDQENQIEYGSFDMNNQDEKKKTKKQFWTAFSFFTVIVIVVFLISAYLILSTLNFFG